MQLVNGKIRVYNYEQNPCGFPSDMNKRGVFIEASNGEEPVMEYIFFSDIEQENTKSDIFKTGRLRFHKDEEEEVYEKLNIVDKENIMTNREMRQLLLDKSTDNLKRIDKIKSLGLLTRMKSVIINMSIGGETVPNQVISVVNEKYDELRYGGRKNENSYLNKLVNEEKESQEKESLLGAFNELNKKVDLIQREKEENEKKSQDALNDLLKMVQALKLENETLKNKPEEKVEEKAKPGRKKVEVENQ
jgi:hypothetical protein